MCSFYIRQCQLDKTTLLALFVLYQTVLVAAVTSWQYQILAFFIGTLSALYVYYRLQRSLLSDQRIHLNIEKGEVALVDGQFVKVTSTSVVLGNICFLTLHHHEPVLVLKSSVALSDWKYLKRTVLGLKQHAQ